MHLNISPGLKDGLCTTEWQFESVPMAMQCDLPLLCVWLSLTANEQLTSIDNNCLCLHVYVLGHVPNNIAFNHPEADIHIHIQLCGLAFRNEHDVGGFFVWWLLSSP